MMNRLYECGLAAVVFNHSLPQVADGTNGKQDAERRVKVKQAVDKVVQDGKDLLHRQKAMVKPIRRGFMAVGYDVALVLIYISASQGKHQPTGIAQKAMGNGLAVIDPLQAAVRVGVGKTAVVFPTVPSLMKEKQVFLSILPPVHAGRQRFGDTDGVEENAVWILEYGKTVVPESFADVFGKAGTGQQYGFRVPDGYRLLFNIQFGSEFHVSKCTIRRIVKRMLVPDR
jgi:hypothetical protein